MWDWVYESWLRKPFMLFPVCDFRERFLRSGLPCQKFVFRGWVLLSLILSLFSVFLEVLFFFLVGGQGVWEQKRSVQSLHSCFFLKKLFLYRWLALQTLKAAFNLGKKSTIMQSMLRIKWMSHLGSLVLGHTTKMQAWDFCFCFFFKDEWIA